jgi:hypothetical protein
LKCLDGTFEDGATRRYPPRGTQLAVFGMFIEKRGTWLGMSGTPVRDRCAIRFEPGASVARWPAWHGGRKAMVDDGRAFVDEPGACVGDGCVVIDEEGDFVGDGCALVVEPL